MWWSEPVDKEGRKEGEKKKRAWAEISQMKPNVTLSSTTLVGLLNRPRFRRPPPPPAAAAAAAACDDCACCGGGGSCAAGAGCCCRRDGPLTVPCPPPTARYWMGLVMPCASRPSPVCRAGARGGYICGGQQR